MEEKIKYIFIGKDVEDIILEKIIKEIVKLKGNSFRNKKMYYEYGFKNYL